MTYKLYSKATKQLKNKPAKLKKFKKHNFPKEKSCGRVKMRCRRCGRVGAHIRKYGIHMCRQCFREVALSLGFKKYN